MTGGQGSGNIIARLWKNNGFHLDFRMVEPMDAQGGADGEAGEECNLSHSMV